MKLKGVSVLIVEDDADSRELLHNALAEEGAKVRSVGSAAAALTLLAKWRPDVLVSDISMPDEDGCSLIRKVRKQGIHVPAIAITGYEGEPHEAFLAGFQLHVSKPFGVDNLVLIIGRLCERSQRLGA